MRRLAVILIALLVIGGLCACHRETDENQIKKIITEIQNAAEAKDVKKIIQNLSEEYQGPQGYHREDIRGLLLGYFLRYPKISVYINNLQIAVEGASAKVTFEAILTSGQKTGSLKDIIPQSFGIYAFDVAMKKENNGWKVISAHWEEMGVDDRKMPPAEK